jgi:phosphatidylglycerophosphate synthase
MHKVPKRVNIFEAMYSFLSSKISPFFIKTSLTPNQVTTISGLFGVLGSYMLILDSHIYLIISAIFIQLYTILDLVDGDIARAKKMQSYFGMWLDIFFDKLIDFLIIVGMSVGVYLRTEDPLMLFVGMLLMGVVFSIQFIMILNETYFKTSRDGNKEIINNMPPSQQKEQYFLSASIASITFFRNHLSLQHSSFLFISSFFAITNNLQTGLIFLLFHGLISLVISIAINFYKIK